MPDESCCGDFLFDIKLLLHDYTVDYTELRPYR